MKVASPNGDGYFFRRSVNFVDTSVKRGDIYYADLSPVVGSEQEGFAEGYNPAVAWFTGGLKV